MVCWEEIDQEAFLTMYYFEDFPVGAVFDLGTITVTEEEIISYARQFDPQYFHVDPERARDSIFGGLVASGWHSTSLFMRLFVDTLLSQTDSIASPGVDEVRWLRPVRPGDTLRGRFTVIAASPSKSRPTMGVVRSRCEMFNQHDELVMTIAGIHFMGRGAQ